MVAQGLFCEWGEPWLDLFCHCQEHAMSAVLRVKVFKVFLARRCVPPQVKLRTSVCVSDDTTCAPSSQEDLGLVGPSQPSGSGLGIQSMASRTPGLKHLSSNQPAPLGGPAVTATGQGSASEPSQSPPSCREIEQRQLNTFDLPEVAKVILAARHPSTKTVYACLWDRFVPWCGLSRPSYLTFCYLFCLMSGKALLRTLLWIIFWPS